MEDLVPVLDDKDMRWDGKIVTQDSEEMRVSEQAKGMLNQRVAFEVDCGQATLYLWGSLGRRGPVLCGVLRPRAPGKTPFTTTFAAIRDAHQMFQHGGRRHCYLVIRT